jgi:hypothetical protein
VKEHVASMFRTEEYAEQEISVKHAGFLFVLFFGPEDGNDMFRRNVC